MSPNSFPKLVSNLTSIRQEIQIQPHPALWAPAGKQIFFCRYEGFIVMCPTEEDWGVLMLSVFIVITHVSGKERRERGAIGLE
jgi:hypothetical protein